MLQSLLSALGLDPVGIILGTHHEKGAFTFWSYAIGLPLPSSSILSWKFCHVLHKVLRDGHPNVSGRYLPVLRGQVSCPSHSVLPRAAGALGSLGPPSAAAQAGWHPRGAEQRPFERRDCPSISLSSGLAHLAYRPSPYPSLPSSWHGE